MIQLHRVTIGGRGRKSRQILRDVSITFPTNARIGILACPGSGKSTIAKHLAGLEKPDFGHISLSGNLSWPLGVAGFLNPYLTISQNLTTLALLKNVQVARYIAWCLSFSDLTGCQNLKVIDLSPSERAALAYASVICLPWDCLIADETITVGDPSMRMKCEAMLEDQAKTAGLVFLSRNPARLHEFCDDFFVLINGQIRMCTDLDAAQHALELSNRTEKEEADHVYS